MVGTRVYPNPDGSFRWLKRGEYIFVDGEWYARVPDPRTNDMDMSSLRGHVVVEHDDGTITVSPSIGHHGRDENNQEVYWHGFLERGVWREA
jgi:hypothetical protein